jgi:ABC-type branched-subunit amino acid transport system ATPase component
MALLEALGVTKQFGGLTAVDSVDFSIEKGMIASLIGPNGAGKTTFFNIITGFYRPTSGEILFDGEPIVGLTTDRVTARGIARTFQNIRLFANMTALENVLVGEHCHLRSGVLGAILHTPGTLAEEAQAEKRARELLDFVGLGKRVDELAKNLPYGDQRRLEIARALATRPKLLLLDEPTAGMNPTETEELTHFLRRLRDELDLTILLIEHHMRVVMDISDRVSVMDLGELIAEGPPAEIQENKRVIEAYLGTGATQFDEEAHD